MYERKLHNPVANSIIHDINILRSKVIGAKFSFCKIGFFTFCENVE